jgi:hypothetical protein
VKLHDIAEAVTPVKVASISMKELQSHILKLSEEDYFLPAISSAVVTMRVSIGLVVSKDWGAFTDCIRFWDTSDSEPVEAWTFDKASFRPLVKSLGNDADEDEEEVVAASVAPDEEIVKGPTDAVMVAKIRDSFLQCFFNDSVLMMFQDPAQHAKDLTNMACAFLDQADAIETFKEDASDLLRPLAQAAGDCIRMFRGVLALVSPRYAWHGSSETDVEFLMPSKVGKKRNKGEACRFVSDMSVHSHAVVRILKENDQWATMLKAYKETLASARLSMPQFEALVKRVDKVMAEGSETPAEGDPEPESSRAKVVSDVIEALPSLRSAFKDGACDELEMKMVSMFRSDFETILPIEVEQAAAGLAKLKDLGTLVGVLKIDSAEKLRQEINEAMQKTASGYRLHKLDMAVQLPFDKASDAESLTKVLMAFKGAAIQEDSASLIADARALLWKLMALSLWRTIAHRRASRSATSSAPSTRSPATRAFRR